MKSNVYIVFIFFQTLGFLSNAQTANHSESHNPYLSEKIKSNDIFSAQLKNASENIFVLDSMYYTSYYGGDTVYTKSTYKYNEKGWQIETIEFYRNSSGSYYPRYKHESELNANGDYTSTIFYQWNSTLMKWIGDSKSEYIFYPDGKLKEDNLYRYDSSTEDWRNSIKKEISYSNDDRYRYDTTFAWINPKNVWQYYIAVKSEWDDKGNRLSYIRSVHNSDDDWSVLEKVEYAYEDDKLILKELYTWRKIQIDEYSYNEFGDEVMFLRKKWDFTDSVWIFSFKKENEFNDLNQLVSETSYDWDLDRNEWIPSYKISFEYDSNGNKKFEKSYDWNVDLNEWLARYSKEYFYSQLTTDAVIISKNQTIKLYPNPANEVLTIETQNPEISIAKLFDLNGKLMKNLTIQQGINSFVISDLKSGVYVIQIPQKEGMIVKKLVKN